MADSKIEWTDKSWNPVRGCSRVSPGCDHCYAMGQAHRFSGPGKPFEGLTTLRRGKVDWTGRARFVPEMLTAPLRWKKPQRIFVNSMSDLFHESLEFTDIAAIFGVMAVSRQHTFQVLTKRPRRAAEWFKWEAERHKVKRACVITANSWCNSPAQGQKWGTVFYDAEYGPWPLPNVWLGVSVEDQKTADERIPLLLQTPAAVRFVSYEPALGPVDFSHWLERIDHCAACGKESPPQEADRCPACGSEHGLISTWGRLQADLYRDGRRHEGELLDGPQLHWVIVGGESGNGARRFDLAWARSVVGKCAEAGVACFVKQLGGRPADSDNSLLGFPQRVTLAHKKGADMSEWPADIQVRQFPQPAG